MHTVAYRRLKVEPGDSPEPPCSKGETGTPCASRGKSAKSCAPVAGPAALPEMGKPKLLCGSPEEGRDSSLLLANAAGWKSLLPKYLSRIGCLLCEPLELLDPPFLGGHLGVRGSVPIEESEAHDLGCALASARHPSKTSAKHKERCAVTLAEI